MYCPEVFKCIIKIKTPRLFTTAICLLHLLTLDFCTKAKWWGKVEQVYRPDFVSPKAGNHSSRPIIAYGLEPSTRMLRRAALWGEPRACLFDVAPDRGYRVSPYNGDQRVLIELRRWP